VRKQVIYTLTSINILKPYTNNITLLFQVGQHTRSTSLCTFFLNSMSRIITAFTFSTLTKADFILSITYAAISLAVVVVQLIITSYVLQKVYHLNVAMCACALLDRQKMLSASVVLGGFIFPNIAIAICSNALTFLLGYNPYDAITY
jgi:hypothetical protein